MAPRKPTSYSIAPKTLIIDNGAYTIKSGLISSFSQSPPECTIIPNCLAKGVGNRIYVGSQLDDCNDFADMTFRRPVQHGCLVNWEAQKEIWDAGFFSSGAKLPVDPSETNLLLTEAPNSLANLQRNCDEIVFEEFDFAAYRRTTGVSLAAYNDIAPLFGDPLRHRSNQPTECILVIDSGYSHTIIAPIYKGRPIQQAIRRLDIGGKFITNYLKEILSTRQLDVRNETYIVNHIKETACFVSQDFKSDLDAVHSHPASTNKVVKDYIMPDFTRRYTGELKEHSPADRKQMSTFSAVRREDGSSEAVLMLGNERFTPSELLFRPDNVGMKEAGLAEAVLQSLDKVPSGLWPAFLANIYLVGGNAKLNGFQERLYTELRALAPTEITIRIRTAENPITATWLGGVKYASDHDRLKDTMLTRQDYQEMGSPAVERYFSGR